MWCAVSTSPRSRHGAARAPGRTRRGWPAPVVTLAEPGGRRPPVTGERLHGLYWLVAALAEAAEPLLLVIDDAHWADAPSLRFVDFLARRVPELAVLVVVGLRPREPGGGRPTS